MENKLPCLQALGCWTDSGLHRGLCCHPGTTHWEWALHFHRDFQTSHCPIPQTHRHQVNDRSCSANHSLDTPFTQGENGTTSSSALLFPRGHSSCPTLTGKISQNPFCSFTSLSPQLPPSSALSCPTAHLTRGATNTSRSCQQLSSHPNPLRTWLSLAETVQRCRERQEREATRATAKTRSPQRTIFTGNVHGISWKQTDTGVFSHPGLCLLSPELLALEAEQRELYPCKLCAGASKP